MTCLKRFSDTFWNVLFWNETLTEALLHYRSYLPQGLVDRRGVCITVVPVRVHGAEAYCHGSASILGIDQPLVFYWQFFNENFFCKMTCLMKCLSSGGYAYVHCNVYWLDVELAWNTSCSLKALTSGQLYVQRSTMKGHCEVPVLFWACLWHVAVPSTLLSMLYSYLVINW